MKTKPFNISKQSVMAAWESVRANQGAAGIDNESISDFELNLKDNLYKIWNRMSSGTYFPPPVMAVEIPKADGSIRVLGIPTVSDRVAQAVVKGVLEPVVEPKFHADSYGYRPKKSALDAVGVARKRCWRYDWCIDLDIKGFFDNLDHDLMMKAIMFHTDKKWIHLYAQRWLTAPMQHKNGELIKRETGTPQGGVASPLFANIFMHHAFDDWMRKHCPDIVFERYADDILAHCSSRKQAEETLEVIRVRLQECGLELHPLKTKIVYCKDGKRDGSYEHEQMDFLGYTFRPRWSKNRRGDSFVGFQPAISKKAIKRIGKAVRSWRLHLRSENTIVDLAQEYNAQLQGWINYYGQYYRSALSPLLNRIEFYLVRWVMKKFKRYKKSKRKATKWLKDMRKREPRLFAHWRKDKRSTVG
jgi:RNA-directed DNA polymerase